MADVGKLNEVRSALLQVADRLSTLQREIPQSKLTNSLVISCVSKAQYLFIAFRKIVVTGQEGWVLSSCTGSQEPIQKSKQCSTAKQRFVKKGVQWLFPLCTGTPGHNRGLHGKWLVNVKVILD